jgi:hypothetical protein
MRSRAIEVVVALAIAAAIVLGFGWIACRVVGQ